MFTTYLPARTLYIKFLKHFNGHGFMAKQINKMDHTISSPKTQFQEKNAVKDSI